MRTTKLSVFCDHVIEAGWLAAVIATPLFFNVYSSRVFEPDKLTLLRSIALFMALAWVIKALDAASSAERRARGGTHNAQHEPRFTFHVSRFTHLIRSTPLVLPTLLLIAIYLISTIASIIPRISFWGSYQRLQGTYTTLAYVIVFLLVLQGLRTREQLDRLITATILASLPVALYGLIQHYGLDPLPWLGDVQKRVASSMGNSIFVAAYLIMVVPLTLLRLLEGFSDLIEAEDDLVPPFIEATGYLFIFLAQLLAIIFSQSRGPLLGLLGGLFVFLLLWAVTRGHRKVVISIVGLGLLAAAFLVVLNLPGTPLEPLRDMPYIGRMGRVFETETGTGKVRVLIWEGTTKMITADPFRTLIGYGPETMHMAYNPFYPPDLAHYEARNASPDRSHNETFDALVITGIVGFVAYLLLFISVFYYGLKWLGLVEDARERNLLLMLITAGGVLAVLGFWLADGTARFFGVALPAGMIVGLFTYLIWATLLRRQRPEADIPFQLTLIALLAAIIGHFVEIHFGIAIAATRTLFWTYAGLMVVVGYLVHERPALTAEPAPQPSSRPKGRSRHSRRRAADDDSGWPWQAALTAAGVGAIILVTLVYDYVTNPARESSPMAIVWHTLFAKWENGQFVTSPAAVWLVGLVWLLTGLLSLATIRRRQTEASSHSQAGASSDLRWWGQAFAIYTVATMFVFLGFGLVVAGRLTPQSNVTLDQAIGRVAGHITLFYVALFTVMVTVAALLTWRRSTPSLWWNSGWPVMLSPILAILVFAVIDDTNLEVVQADIMYKQAWNGYHSNGQYDAAIATYRQALELQPDEDYYYLFLGKAYLEKIRSANDPAERDRLFEASRQALENAQRLNPLNPDHAANLARLHQQWAQATQVPERRRELYDMALQYHDQATNLAPNAAHLHNEWAVTLDQMGRFDEALTKLEKSKKLDPIYSNTQVYMGEVYRHAGQTDKAIEAYQEALGLDPKRVDAYRGLALLYEYQGETDKAIEQYLGIVDQRPKDVAAHQRLAILYHQQGQLDAAQREAEVAAQLATNNPLPHVLLGDIYRLRGKMQPAIDEYQRALSLNPQTTEAYQGLALAYNAQGDASAALDNARQALELDPNNEALQSLAQSLEQQSP
ncbi:MAG: Photosystem I assembly protein Ycf3 [Anaerolineales bacterium]|nr:Photosystem I assembly protein Ycf3 [Anaerolineales bacterium]